jgi:hypothetical protein
MNDDAELARFMRGETDLAGFPHREHVRMGFEMLRIYSFDEAAFRYCGALRAMLTRAGKLAAFHQTVTIAFLSLIAERMQAESQADFQAFVRANPDLIDKSALSRWYRPERLGSAMARRTFLLPDAAT